VAVAPLGSFCFLHDFLLTIHVLYPFLYAPIRKQTADDGNPISSPIKTVILRDVHLVSTVAMDAFWMRKDNRRTCVLLHTRRPTPILDTPTAPEAVHCPISLASC